MQHYNKTTETTGTPITTLLVNQHYWWTNTTGEPTLLGQPLICHYWDCHYWDCHYWDSH